MGSEEAWNLQARTAVIVMRTILMIVESRRRM